MDAAILGIILDSSVVIEAERRHLNAAQFLSRLKEKIGEMGPPCARSQSRSWRTEFTALTHMIGGNGAELSPMI